MDALSNNTRSTSNCLNEPNRPRAALSRCALGCPRVVSAAMTALTKMTSLTHLVARLLVSVMTISASGIASVIKQMNAIPATTNTEVLINDLDTAKSLLKGHRRSGNFFLPNESSDINLEDNILTCSPENTRKLRSVYQHLFGNAQSRDKIRQILQKVIGELPSFSPLYHAQWLNALTNRIAANILFGMEPNDQLNAVDFDPRGPNRLSHTFLELLQNSPNAELLQWMKQQGLSDSQIDQSLFFLYGVIQGNVLDGLTTLVSHRNDPFQMDYEDGLIERLRKLMFDRAGPSVIDTVRIDLRNLMKDGQSLWEAANASKIIDSVCIESLRYAPVVPDIDRLERTGPDQTRRHNVYIRALANTNVGDHAYQFCPMRYVGKNKEHWPSHDFLPFGYGRHECPAWWLYKQTAVYFLAALSMNFTTEINLFVSDRMVRNDELL